MLPLTALFDSPCPRSVVVRTYSPASGGRPGRQRQVLARTPWFGSATVSFDSVLISFMLFSALHQYGTRATLCLTICLTAWSLLRSRHSITDSMVMKTTALSSVFCYGTLMAPEVIQTLIGRVPLSQSAHLCGSAFRRHPVRNHMFPGLITVRSTDNSTANTTTERVQGVLYRDLSVNEMQRLDWFEGDEYDKIPCTVELVDDDDDERNNEQVSTQVYLWANPITELDLTRPWSYERFREKNLATYLERTVLPCRQQLDQILPAVESLGEK